MVKKELVMEISKFLAKYIGIYLIIVGIDLFFRRKEVEKAIKDFSSSKGLIAFSGSFSLLIGLAIVIGHPVFSFDWHGLITLTGILLILRGLLRIAAPAHVQKTLTFFFQDWYWILVGLSFIVGIILTYCGFFAAA
jgi:hypothetical protein